MFTLWTSSKLPAELHYVVLTYEIFVFQYTYVKLRASVCCATKRIILACMCLIFELYRIRYY